MNVDGLKVVVRGSGDIGSAVAHQLVREACAVVIQEDPTPTTTRRGMAFTDAVFDGWTSLDGIDAIRARDTTDVRRLLAAREAIPVYVGALEPLLKEVAPAVLVDARMRKHEAPQGQCGLAGLTIGLGPGRGISERPRRIADGVLKAIRKWDDRPPR